MASVSLRPATSKDANDIANILYAAYGSTNVLYQAFFENNIHAGLVGGITSAIDTASSKFIVAVDGVSGETIGSCRYCVVRDPSTTESSTKHDEPEPKSEGIGVHLQETQPSPHKIKSHLKEVWARLNKTIEEIDQAFEETVAGKAHYQIEQLMVHPEHQRRGLGTKMLRWVLDRCDEDGLPAYIQSSRESHQLYLNHGFKDLGTWKRDNAAFAREIVRIESQMGLASDTNLLSSSEAGEEEAIMVRQPRIA